MLENPFGRTRDLFDNGDMTIGDKALVLVTRFDTDLLALFNRQCDLSFRTHFRHAAILFTSEK
jgi:hypothetical protein